MIWWLVPPIIENYPDGRALVDKYVLVGLIHAHAEADSTFDFDSVDHLVAADADGKPLKLLNEDEMPPTVAGALSALKSVFVHALRPMGKGTHWFAFEGGKVHACGKGRLTIPFAGETYFCDTPIRVVRAPERSVPELAALRLPLQRPGQQAAQLFID
jgi:hypothetical protein